MSILVDEEIGRFFQQTGAEAMYQQEAYFHAEWHRYRQHLNLFNAAMANSNVEEGVRREVIRQVLFGGPDEAAAIDRMRAQKRALEEEAIGMPPMPKTGQQYHEAFWTNYKWPSPLDSNTPGISPGWGMW